MADAVVADGGVVGVAPEEPIPITQEDAVTAGYYLSKSLSPFDVDACRSPNDAVWSLSTARPGNGIPQLLGDDVRSYRGGTAERGATAQRGANRR